MRRQYYFQDSERGLLAWDVHRLIDLSRELPREWIRLEAIRELDEGYWLDSNDEKPTCRWVAAHMKLVEESSLEHPIILSSSGRVMDGTSRPRRGILEYKMA